MAKIIDGKKIADEIKVKLKQELEVLKSQGVYPSLGAILVGDNPASKIYVGMKEKECVKLGINLDVRRFEKDLPQNDVIKNIEEFNNNKDISGILVQLPLPPHLNESEILMSINPEKDVDGLHPINFGKLLYGEPKFIPCTPAGILEILNYEKIDTVGKNVVIVGRSNIVGKPIAALLMRKAENANATVTVCHTKTKDLSHFTKQADILIAAMGDPERISGEMVKEGVIVIDVGQNRVSDSSLEKGYRIVGDVHFESVEKKAKAITPVPGGVGPLTIVMLLKNTIWAAKNLHNAQKND
jgi:methylenetetrahydrofolate dehydrogenase (NADP+)/methenyltetrahydrofolate cyclohydrolase